VSLIHYKTYWRLQIVSLLTGATLADNAVYTNRKAPNQTDTLWINVKTSAEDVAGEPHQNSLARVTPRNQRYQIDICTKDNETPEDTVETVGGQVEQLLLDDEFLSGSAFGIDYEGSQEKKSETPEQTTIIYSLMFNVRGTTPRTNPFYG